MSEEVRNMSEEEMERQIAILEAEGRREKEKAQDAVTGVIINRVLGQNSVHTQGREVTLLNVVTTEKQFTTLEMSKAIINPILQKANMNGQAGNMQLKMPIG